MTETSLVHDGPVAPSHARHPSSHRKSGASMAQRLAAKTYSLAAVVAAMQEAPGKPRNKADRCRAVADFCDWSGTAEDEILDYTKLKTALDQMDHRAGRSPSEVKRMRGGVLAALAASRLEPILTPIHLDHAPCWVSLRKEFAVRDIECPAQFPRFCGWAQARGLQLEEICNGAIEVFFQDLAMHKSAHYARWATAGLVDALRGFGLDLEPIQSDGRHIVDKSRIPVTLLTDIDAFVKASQAPVLHLRLRTWNDRSKPLSASSANNLGCRLLVAADAFLEAGGSLTGASRLAALVSLNAVERTICGLSRRAKSLSPAYRRDVIEAVIMAARFHCRRGRASVEALTDRLSTMEGWRGPSLNGLKPLLDKKRRRELVNSPNKIRFHAARRKRRDHELNDLQAALSLEIILQAPRMPADLVGQRFGETMVVPVDDDEPVRIAPLKTPSGTIAFSDWIALDPRAGRAVRSYRCKLEAMGAPLDHVFVAWDVGSCSWEPIDEKRLSRQLTVALDRAIGLRLTFVELYLVHGLVRLLDRPEDIRRVQQVYGWKDVTYTLARFRPVLGLKRSKQLAALIKRRR